MVRRMVAKIVLKVIGYMKKGQTLRGLFRNLLDSKRYQIRILHNLFANTLAQGINTFGQLVMVPTFLCFWGKELYGEWLLLSTIPAYFAMNDVGFAGAGATEMTVLVARNERTAALEVFQSIWVLISATSLLLLIALASVLMWLPVDSWLNITHLGHGRTTLIILLLLSQTAISQQSGLIQAGFRCEGSTALGVHWFNALRMGELLLTAGVVAGGGQPLMVAATSLFIRLTGTVLMRLHLYRVSPWLAFGWRHCRFAEIRRLAGPAFSFIAFPLGHALKNQGIVIAVGRVLGPVGVVAFTTVRTLTNAAYQVMTIIHVSVWPEMSAALGAGQLHVAKGLHRNSCRASIWLSIGSAMGLCILGDRIYRAWIHESVQLDLPLFYVLLTVIVANSLWFTSSMVPMAINRHQRTALSFLAGGVIALILVMWMLPRWGLAGAGFALLAIDVVMIIQVVPHSLTLVQDHFTEFALAVMKPPYRLALLTLQREP